MVIRLSIEAYYSNISAEQSVLPSSTHIISNSLYVLLIIESKHLFKYSSVLNTGTITDIKFSLYTQSPLNMKTSFNLKMFFPENTE